MKEPKTCMALGPERILWGGRVNLVCSLLTNHSGDHCDQSITGFSTGNYWPRSVDDQRKMR